MESDLRYWIALFACFVFSALFSSTETALISVPESYVKKLIEESRGKAYAYRLWLERPNAVLTAIVIGNNLVNTLAAVIATVYAQKIFDEFVIGIATGVMTIALIIFGEIAPKTYGRHNARALLPWLIHIIYPVYFLLFPAVWVVSHAAVFLVRAFGGRTSREGPLATEDDIAYLIRLSHQEGVFKKEQGKMLESVISFRETSAREIMVPRTDLCTLELDADYEKIMDQIAQHGYTRWPVFEDDIDHIVGVLYVKDLLNFKVSEANPFVLKDHIRKAIFIPDSMKVDLVLKEMQRQKVHLTVVVDEYGGTAGIVTMEDILEEIVGEIRDEYDKEEEEETVKKLGVEHFLVDGRTSISDLQKQTEIELPTDESYDSVGGFLVSLMGKIPNRDSSLVYGPWLFVVREVEEKRILKVEITLNSSEQTDIIEGQEETYRSLG
jgi:putative hemolysin